MRSAEKKTQIAAIERKKSSIAVALKKACLSFILGLLIANKLTQNPKVMLQAVKSALMYSASMVVDLYIQLRNPATKSKTHIDTKTNLAIVLFSIRCTFTFLINMFYIIRLL